ncbi:hypothetical protein NMG60_11002833 [Bertholletia excelsa]
MFPGKRQMTNSYERSDFFDGLPDDIVVSILCKISSNACSPSDFISILITCKRLNQLGLNPLVLSTAGPGAFAIRAKNWSERCHRFLKHCADSGNVEACYTLGMIRFYCLENRASGASLMAKAAIRSHAPALYSLAVIQFNGSGSCKNDKDLRAGVALCARAAFLGHIDALRELGHCFQDGFGIPKNAAEGHRFLLQANAREIACALRDTASTPTAKIDGNFPYLVRTRDAHPANRFLTEWFGSDPGKGLRMCSHAGCGRPETRRNEFRRCSACGAVNYCSRGCQAQDWKLRHKVECSRVDRLFDQVAAYDGDVVYGDDLMADIEQTDGH